MRVLGLLMVRNGAARVGPCLDALARCCDAVLCLDDRSTDATTGVLAAHPIVAGVFTAPAELSQEPWHFPESQALELLYRMADFHEPDWVIFPDDDQVLVPAESVRPFLEACPEKVNAVETDCVSTWGDDDYPLLVPLMGRARRRVIQIWRHAPALHAGRKRLHNLRVPANLPPGRAVRTSAFNLEHHGWSTLERRIATVDLYSSLDPAGELNFGVPYDVGLLFGFRRDQVDALVDEYRRRYQARVQEITGCRP